MITAADEVWDFIALACQMSMVFFFFLVTPLFSCVFKALSKMVRQNDVFTLWCARLSPVFLVADSSAVAMTSYEKLALSLVGLMLVWHNMRAGYTVQALSLVLTMRAVLKESAAESALMLVPFVLLGERCLSTTLSLGHSPLPFYAAALFSYIASFPSSGSWPFYYWCAFGAGSGGLLAALTGKPLLAIGLAAQFVVGGLVILVSSRDAQHRSVDGPGVSKVNKRGNGTLTLGSKNRREVLLVASIVAALVLDVFANSNVGSDLGESGANDELPSTATNTGSIAQQLRLTQLTSFTHIAGRSCIVCAVVIAVVAALLAQRRQSAAGVLSKPFTRSIVFFVFAGGMIAAAFAYVSWVMEENALQWLWAYLHSRKLRLYAVLLWATGIPLAVLGFHLFAASTKEALPQAVFRKLYHALSLVAFLPIAIIDPSFLAFAIAAATGIFVILECARCLEVRGTKWVTAFVEHQIDERDGGIVRTHVYLMFGLGLSIFFRHRSELVMSRPTPFPLVLACDLIPGLIGLGVVDAMAAVMGTRASRKHTAKVLQRTASAAKEHHDKAPTTLAQLFCWSWFSSSHNTAMQRKTLVGCVYGFVSGSALWTLILVLLFGPSVLVSRWLAVGIASIAAATWWEGVCNGIDNLELPLFVYACVTAFGTFGLR